MLPGSQMENQRRCQSTQIQILNTPILGGSKRPDRGALYKVSEGAETDKGVSGGTRESQGEPTKLPDYSGQDSEYPYPGGNRRPYTVFYRRCLRGRD